MAQLSPLQQELLSMSRDMEWDIARFEWQMIDLWQEQGGTCLCGQHPITDHCLIHNRMTGAQAVIGNHCVRQFQNHDYSNLFDAVRRIRKNPESATPAVLVKQAAKFGWLAPHELKFTLSTFRKHSLSTKQRDWRVAINRKLVRLAEQPPACTRNDRPA